MDQADTDALHTLVLSTLTDAWTARDMPIDALSRSLHVWIESGDEPMVWATAIGARGGLGFDGSALDLDRAAVDLARYLASELEDDRTIGGPWADPGASSAE